MTPNPGDLLAFPCPCGARLQAAAALEGCRVRCPACAAIVRVERVHLGAPLIDPEPCLAAAPPPNPDRAVPYEPSPEPAEAPFRQSLLARVWGDFMIPVCATWFVLIGICLYTQDDMGETPARVMFVAYTAGMFFAGLRLPKHMDLGLTEALF